MKNKPNRQITLLAIILIGICTQLVAATAEEGFRPIFNGKDLTGWEGNPQFWSVTDGFIRGQTTPDNPTKGNTFIVWRDGKPKNFVLKAKFRLTDGNSGIQYRSKELGKWVIGGYQADIMNTQGTVGFLYEERGRGWLVSVGDIMVVDKDGKKNIVGKIADPKELIKAGYFKENDWNEYTIVCRGNHVVHYLNGFQTMELIDNDPKGRMMEGLIALQLHAGPPMTIDFKDIRLKPLKENYEDAILLFNTKDLTGWTFSSEKNKQAWGVKDGVLTDTGKPVGYLRTEKDYTNYVLRLQMRHLGKGNCGVLLRMVGKDKVWPRSIEAQGRFRSMGDIWNIDQFPMKVDPARTNGRHTRKINNTNEKEVGGWNEYEIYLNKGDLKLYVNSLLQNMATKCWETPGKICLQAEGSPVEFRNIVLLPIKN